MGLTSGAELLSQARPELASFARDLAARFPYNFRIAEVARDQARQLWLFASGRTRPGPIVTSVQTSAHTTAPLSSAIDFDILDAAGNVASDSDPAWDVLGDWARAAGFTWGGDWNVPKDKRHVEIPGWRKWVAPAGISIAVALAAGVVAYLLFGRRR